MVQFCAVVVAEQTLSSRHDSARRRAALSPADSWLGRRQRRPALLWSLRAHPSHCLVASPV